MEHTEQEYRQVLQFIVKKMNDAIHSSGYNFRYVLVDHPIICMIRYLPRRNSIYECICKSDDGYPIATDTFKQFYSIITSNKIQMTLIVKKILTALMNKPFEELLMMSDIECDDVQNAVRVV